MTKNNRDQDVEFIKALAELLRENDLNELEVSREYGEDDSLNVRVARGGVVAAPVMASSTRLRRTCASCRTRRSNSTSSGK
jgi:acetyl-CoA carboxylase biotin carboxyl carrier protein